MSHKLLTVGVMLGVVLGCDDLPTAPDAARAPPPVGLSTEVLAAMHALLDDPFLEALIAQADQARADRAVRRAMQAVAEGLGSGNPTAMRRALSTADRALREPGDVEAAVHRAALGLTLDAVSLVLDSVAKAGPNQGDGPPLDLRGGHDD